MEQDGGGDQEATHRGHDTVQRLAGDPLVRLISSLRRCVLWKERRVEGLIASSAITPNRG